MTREKPKPYIILVIISIVLITILSMGIIVIMASWVQGASIRFTGTSEVLTDFRNLADTDIQIVLQEDSAKYETAYSYLNDLYTLNERYTKMLDYNATHPLNFTQQDFDEVKIDFTSKMRSLNFIVQSTSVYYYSVEKVGASVANNYTYLGFDFYFIRNQWFDIETPRDFHDDIKDYINTSFASTGTPLDIPEIRFEIWTYHLYNNLSILDSIGYYGTYHINTKLEDIGLNLVNLSLAQLDEYINDFSEVNARLDTLYQHFSNILVTFAISGVLMGFATSFDNLNFRRISMIVGLLVLFIAIVYVGYAISDLYISSIQTAIIRGENEFHFI